MKTFRVTMQQHSKEIGQLAGSTLVAVIMALPVTLLLLLLFMVGDIILGFVVALRRREVTLDKMYDGGLKKAVVLILVCILMIADIYLLPQIFGREHIIGVGEFTLSGALALYYAFREFLSMATHAATAEAPLPPFVIKWAQAFVERFGQLTDEPTGA